MAVDAAFFALLAGSYARLTGKSLTPEGRGAEWLYLEAPFAVLAHDEAMDPRFIYGNRAAQTCFEYEWDELVGLPSRLSAETPERAERQRLLEAVRRDGVVTGYQGVRIAKSGRRFRIEDGVIWQLVDERGVVHGQAAAFSSWRDA
ncbi:MAG: MEKHLA domain-containing protein [Steroidobacteraceae bacterium]